MNNNYQKVKAIYFHNVEEMTATSGTDEFIIIYGW